MTDGTVEVVSEGTGKLFTPKPEAMRQEMGMPRMPVHPWGLQRRHRLRR